MKRKQILLKPLLVMFCAAGPLLSASNLANPLLPIPAARIGIGVSYHLDGITITNRAIPCLQNRFHARASYAPISLVNFGVDAGVTQIDVATDTTGADTLTAFHGNYQFSWGAHLKVSTPMFIKNRIGFLGIVQGTSFSSSNVEGALYRGYDATAAAGILLRIPKFGYVAVGPQVYLIARGLNKSYDGGAEQPYSNINNVRGWLAIDFFPPIKAITTNRPYISLELSAGPEARLKQRAPIQEVSFSISIGTITKRLYGEASEVEWEP
jgi:hypothetical protein